MSRIQEVTLHNFAEEVLHADQPVLVDFYAPWCGPCKMITPTLTALANEFSGRAKIVKVHVDEEQELAQFYRVSSIPSLFFFKEGEVIDQLKGLVSLNILRDKLVRLTRTPSVKLG